MRGVSAGDNYRWLEAIQRKRINLHLGTTGEVWQDECYDRIVRDEEHLYRCLQYIGRNPTMAGLTRDECPLWINPEWLALGWKFEA
jgi:hypothetical protein